MTFGRALLVSTVSFGVVAALGCSTSTDECEEGTVAKNNECVPIIDTADTGTETDADTDADSDTDTDADSDTDTDADSDTDSDTDTAEPQISGFSGETTYTATVDGEMKCDVTAHLAGTNYAGACEDCEFSFEVDSTVVEDNSTQCGAHYTGYSFIEDEGFSNLVVEYAPEYLLYDTYLLEKTFFSHYDYNGYTYTRLIYYLYNGVNYNPYVSFSRSGDSFEWGFSFDSYGLSNYAYCGTAAYSYASESYDGESDSGSIPCDASAIDVWTFVAAETEATVTIDTLSDATSFDPWGWVNGPTGCADAWADNNFTCSYRPTSGSCPSYELTDLSIGGYYEVVVISGGGAATPRTSSTRCAWTAEPA